MSQHAKSYIGLSDRLFYLCMSILGGAYVLLVVAMLLADAAYMVRGSGWHQIVFESPIFRALSKPEIRYSILLSLVSCTLSAILSVFVAVPIGWLLARLKFKGRNLVDAVLDIPIVLPPLVVGLSLLILFQFWPFTSRIPGVGRSLNELVVYQVPAVILAQFAVAAAFAVRTMKATFDQINPRCEQVALTLGCSRAQSFMRVALPEAGRGMLTAFTLAWARALGEFGPLLIFAGATRNKTEVLSTTVFLELSIGDLEAAVAVSLIMVFTAVTVLIITRVWGTKDVNGMIRVENITVRAGKFALTDVSLDVPAGCYGALMGRTGSGKTTLLEAIIGLKPVETGKIILDGRDVTKANPSARGIGYVPQDGALFSTMTIREHLAFALEIRREKRDAVEQRVQELAGLLGITHLLDRYPFGLSGGERQRVALGRALSFRPAILLLDEPLSAVDEGTRSEMYELLRKVQAESGVTALHITHNLAEARELADAVFILKHGKITEERNNGTVE